MDLTGISDLDNIIWGYVEAIYKYELNCEFSFSIDYYTKYSYSRIYILYYNGEYKYFDYVYCRSNRRLYKNRLDNYLY